MHEASGWLGHDKCVCVCAYLVDRVDERHLLECMQSKPSHAVSGGLMRASGAGGLRLELRVQRQGRAERRI